MATLNLYNTLEVIIENQLVFFLYKKIIRNICVPFNRQLFGFKDKNQEINLMLKKVILFYIILFVNLFLFLTLSMNVALCPSVALFYQCVRYAYLSFLVSA